MKRLIKKVIPLVMAITLMIAFAVTTHAQEVCPPHIEGTQTRTIVNEINAGTHQHPYIIDDYGNVIEYKTCSIKVRNWRYVIKCKNCGIVLKTETKSETIHSVH